MFDYNGFNSENHLREQLKNSNIVFLTSISVLTFKRNKIVTMIGITLGIALICLKENEKNN